MPKRVLVLDTETTGFSPEHDRIVEFAAAEVQPRTGVVRSDLHRLINPCRSIPSTAVRVHGITNDKVANQPTFREIADEIAAFARLSIEKHSEIAPAAMKPRSTRAKSGEKENA
jgi:DNA polymerase III epsilon subunit-like protein